MLVPPSSKKIISRARNVKIGERMVRKDGEPELGTAGEWLGTQRDRRHRSGEERRQQSL